MRPAIPHRIGLLCLFCISFVGGVPSTAAGGKSSQSICGLVEDEYYDIIGQLGLRHLEERTDQPSWQPSTVTIAKRQTDQADFDFYNDGIVDRIYMAGFEDHYMQGTVLLVQPGRSTSEPASVSDDPLEDPKAWFIPCQLSSDPIPLKECPPFSQQHDEAKFLASAPGSKPVVWFRVRYTDIVPIRFNGLTYLIATSRSKESRQDVTVMKPLPNRKFAHLCNFPRMGRLDAR